MSKRICWKGRAASLADHSQSAAGAGTSKRIGETVNNFSVACEDFVPRPGTHHHLPYVEIEGLRNEVNRLWNHVGIAFRASQQDIRNREWERRQAAKRPDPTAGYIYFADCAGYTKIGFSTDSPSKTGGRIASMQTGMPFEINLWGYARGKPDLERGLHRKYAHCRHRGEWFLLAQAHRDELAVLARKTKGKIKKSKVPVYADEFSE